MTSILKNQIIKHLSAFARNIKPEQISVEVLKGKGQLRNLELNEDVLAERLELPPWLKIVSAHCSCVSVKIPSWHKIRSAPVQLFIEEIKVIIRLVATPITNMRKSNISTGKPYDLAERVIEGISLYIQSVEIFFEMESQSQINFGGSITLTQLTLESRTPTWQSADSNLNMTRIHDKTIRQLLFFKHIAWRILKIEASATLKTDDHYGNRHSKRSSLNSPLRFLTENGKCRITIKKSTLDCSLIAGRIELILDEIHWLAYMAHLRSAIDFYKHILDLANSTPNSTVVPRTDTFTPSHAVNPKLTSNAFRQFDIPQSSHHLSIHHIDLHFCDDSSADALPHDWNIDSGAIQAIIQKLRIDFYPRHSVFENNGDFSTRHSWLRYPIPNAFTDLAKMQLDQHFRLFSGKMEQNARERFVRIWPQLTSQNVVLRIENLTILSVSERHTRKDALKNMFSMDKKAKELHVPLTLSFFHMEATSYQFAASTAYPVPPDSFHIVIAPFEFSPDSKSIRWLVYAIEDILSSFEAPQINNSEKEQSSLKQSEIRVELIMPKVILSSNEEGQSNPQPETDDRFPRRFVLNTANLIISNFILLNDALIPFPIMYKKRLQERQSEFIKWAQEQGDGTNILTHLERRTGNIDAFHQESSANEWFFYLPSLWVNCDFGPDSWDLPLLMDLSIIGSIMSGENEISILVEPKTCISVTLDHFQFVQLTRLVDEFSSLLDQVAADRQFFSRQLPSRTEHPSTTVYFKSDKVILQLILPFGHAPSPYDLKGRNNEGNSQSSSRTSACSEKDLPALTTAINNSEMAKHGQQRASPLNLNPNAGDTAETIPGFVVQSGLRTVENVDDVSNISVSGKIPMDVQPSRKQIIGTANFPEFPGIVTPSDLESNIDETLSLTTTNSGEQFFFDGTTTAEDDSFAVLDEDVVEAEEAIESNDQSISVTRRKERVLNRRVNVLDVILQDMNVYARIRDTDTTAYGFAYKVNVNERLDRSRSEIYNEEGDFQDIQEINNSQPSKKISQSEMDRENPVRNANLKLEIHSKPKANNIKVDVSGLDLSLSSDVVSQLGPFIQNPTEETHPPVLDLSLHKCQIEINDPNKKFPLKIRLGELSIEDGPG